MDMYAGLCFGELFELLQRAVDSEKNKSPAKSDFSLKANLAVELTKGADFELLINQTTGDELTIRGGGNINMKYDSDMSGVKLFGQYTVDDGLLQLPDGRLGRDLELSQSAQQPVALDLAPQPGEGHTDQTQQYRL